MDLFCYVFMDAGFGVKEFNSPDACGRRKHGSSDT
jgi:hypothetical protein